MVTSTASPVAAKPNGTLTARVAAAIWAERHTARPAAAKRPGPSGDGMSVIGRE